MGIHGDSYLVAFYAVAQPACRRIDPFAASTPLLHPMNVLPLFVIDSYVRWGENHGWCGIVAQRHLL